MSADWYTKELSGGDQPVCIGLRAQNVTQNPRDFKQHRAKGPLF